MTTPTDSLSLSVKTTMEKSILVDREPSGIATVTINRPKRLNSLTRGLIDDLATAFKSLSRDDSVRLIILTGSGTAFSAGVDLTSAQDVFKGDVKDMDRDVVYQMENCPKPIIGAINGYAITAGFEIALACDILIAAKSAKFIDTHARFGIFPSWGLSQKLSRIIGPNRAREVSLTAMPVSAEMAEKWGLVNHVVEGNGLLKKARDVAESILRNNQDLVFRYKAVINDGLKLDLGHALTLEKMKKTIVVKVQFLYKIKPTPTQIPRSAPVDKSSQKECKDQPLNSVSRCRLLKLLKLVRPLHTTDGDIHIEQHDS